MHGFTECFLQLPYNSIETVLEFLQDVHVRTLCKALTTSNVIRQSAPSGR